MIIFALLLVLFACAAFAGWCFGVIRATTTFVGLLVSIVLAKIFAHSFGPLFAHVGITNPFLQWMLSPLPVFLISLGVFKIIGLVAQKKVDLYYKYKAGDLRLGLWNRLNPGLGLSVGLANALIYMVLISMVIYVLSYPTVQLAAGNGDHWSVRFLNETGRELQSVGLTKVAAAVNPMPKTYYEAADLAGLIYHNDLLEARLGRYPAFISLGETPEFQQIAASKDFTELRQRQPPFMEIADHPLMQPLINNPDILNKIWALVADNLQDLESFLQTGLSEKYADKHLVGRWDINFPRALSALLEASPNYTPSQMRKDRRELSLMITNTTTLVATLEGDVYLKNIGNVSYVTNTVTPAATPQRGAPGAAGGRSGAFNFSPSTEKVFGLGRGGGGGGLGGPPPAPVQAAAPVVPAPRPITTITPTVKFDSLQGKWSGSDNDYRIQLANRRNLGASVDADKLTVTGFAYPLVFDRRY